MSTSSMYRPRQRQQRTPNCGYCKEDGHWMKHRDGTVICPKLQEKQRRKQQSNHRAAQARRSAISSGEWVSAQQMRTRMQTEQQQKSMVTQNRFAIPSDSESDDESQMQVLVAKPRVAQGAWAKGASAKVKSEGKVKDSIFLIKKRSICTGVYLNAILDVKRAELDAMDRASTSWAIKQEIDELEETIESLEHEILAYQMPE